MRLLRFFQPIVYIKLDPDTLKVRDVGAGRELSEPPVAAVTRDAPRRIVATGNAATTAATSQPVDLVNPFKHPRTLISDFTMAEQVIKGQLKKLLAKRSVFARPIVVLHPDVDPEGGFTQIESRALRELGFGAGASKVFVWHGRALSEDELSSLRFGQGGQLLD